MNPELKKLWDCWILGDPNKQHWSAWVGFLTGMPQIRDLTENDVYYRIYQDRIESGHFRPEPRARGRWILGRWIMRS